MADIQKILKKIAADPAWKQSLMSQGKGWATKAYDTANKYLKKAVTTDKKGWQRSVNATRKTARQVGGWLVDQITPKHPTDKDDFISSFLLGQGLHTASSPVTAATLANAGAAGALGPELALMGTTLAGTYGGYKVGKKLFSDELPDGTKIHYGAPSYKEFQNPTALPPGTKITYPAPTKVGKN